MRGLSIGAILYIVLIVAVLFCGPLSSPVVAQPGIVVGFVVGDKTLITSSEAGLQVGSYLQAQLSIPVKMRSFAAEKQLYSWLTRYRQVDVAWLSVDFLQEVPSGELFAIARNRGQSAGQSGEIVSRQGVNSTLREQLREAFLAMNESEAGRDLLSQLGGSQFVAPPLWQTKDRGSVVQQPDDSGSLDEKDAGWKTSSWQGRESTSPSSSVSITKQDDPASESVSVKSYETGAVAEEEQVPAVPQGDVVVEESMPASSMDEDSVESLEPVELVADYLAYNADEDSYEAKGDVVLRRSGVELRSEALLWQSATQDAAATGSISLEDKEARVSGEQLHYNMATGQGQIQQGQVFVSEGNFHLTGDQIEKQGHAEYMVRNGSFTTCDGEIPDWKFSAEEVNVTLGGYATARNVFFHIKDVPVLYAPYLFFPVKTERESGLLTPWLGYSNNKGTRASVAWYQVIDRNMDATFYLDYLSEVALGKGLEYRYALAKQNIGEALYYHVNGINDTPDMYYLEWKHSGNLPGKWQLTADVEYADKKQFFDEFGEIAEEYNRDKTLATIVLSKHWDRLNFVAHGRYIKDLEDEDNDTVLQRLPELSLSQASYRIGNSPLYLGAESYATRFWSEEGVDDLRLYLKPKLSAVFKPGSWLEVVPEAILHGRLYDADADSDNDLLAEYKLTLSTRLKKSFAFSHWGIDRLQHSIEPKATYTYIPEEDQSSLPEFDLYDRIEQSNDVSYELVNRFVARYAGGDGARKYRDFMLFRLSQSYDIDEARHNTSGEDQPFSDVSLELDFRPTRNISLDVESQIPVYGSTRFRTLSVGIAAKDDSGNAVKVHYNYKDDDFASVSTDHLRVQLDTELMKPVYLRFEERYDFRQERELERGVGLEYRSKCWSLLLTYRNRYQDDGEDDHEIMFNLVLAGLGQNKGFGNAFGAAGNLSLD